MHANPRRHPISVRHTWDRDRIHPYRQGRERHGIGTSLPYAIIFRYLSVMVSLMLPGEPLDIRVCGGPGDGAV